MTTRHAPTLGVTLPATLLTLYRATAAHDATLPPASHLLEAAMRDELSRRGIPLPPPRPPTRTAAATAARIRRRAQQHENIASLERAHTVTHADGPPPGVDVAAVLRELGAQPGLADAIARTRRGTR